MIGRIELLGQQWTVRVVGSAEMCDDTQGECHFERREILISNSLDGPHRDSVLLHECLHAILSISGLSEVLGERLEEAVITSVENGLHQAGYRPPISREKMHPR